MGGGGGGERRNNGLMRRRGRRRLLMHIIDEQSVLKYVENSHILADRTSKGANGHD